MGDVQQEGRKLVPYTRPVTTMVLACRGCGGPTSRGWNEAKGILFCVNCRQPEGMCRCTFLAADEPHVMTGYGNSQGEK